MTSFREEIQSVLDYISEYGLDCEPYTDKILKLIEKRIDDLIEDVDELRPKEKYQEAKNILLHVKEMLK